MSRTIFRRFAVLAGLLLVALAGVTGSSRAEDPVRIRAVRTGVLPERTRVVLDLDVEGVTWRVAEKTARGAVILLAGVELPSGTRTDLSDVGGIESGGLATEGDRGLRIALRFRDVSDVKIFTLADPPRWVLDVVPAAGGSRAAEPEAPKTPQQEESPKVGSAEGSAVPEPSIVSPAREALPPEPEVELAPLPERRGPRIVVIDPGHGGEDPGATGPGLREKDVCLDVARRLHRALSALEGVHPVLSRSRDVLVPLRQRTRLAEEVEADLFVSIHVNASGATEAQGVEVFFLSLRGASDEATRELAKTENEALSATPGEAEEPNAELPFSLSLRQSDTLLRSSRAAETVLDTFVSRELAENRGVRQAAFAVLKSVEVPSILVELGFASSSADREKLKQEAYRQALADALAEGVASYFERFAPVRGAR